MSIIPTWMIVLVVFSILSWLLQGGRTGPEDPKTGKCEKQSMGEHFGNQLHTSCCLIWALLLIVGAVFLVLVSFS